VNNKKIAVVFDVDGVFTDGTFWQNKNEKYLKRFGPDDFDALDELRKHACIKLITADSKGFSIVHSRTMAKGLPLTLVSNKPKKRWRWIKDNLFDYYIIYVGDGIYDWYPLEMCDFGITTVDALPHVQDKATYISPRTGANRFVADVCLYVLKYFFEVDICKIGQ